MTDMLPAVLVDIRQALDRLCFRFPSLLVDAITEHEPGRRLVAVKNVTVNEEFFQGHFPGDLASLAPHDLSGALPDSERADPRRAH